MLQTVRKQRRLFVTDPHAPLKSFDFPGSAYKLDYFGQARLWSSSLARKRSSGCLRVPMCDATPFALSEVVSGGISCGHG
jgi:hypothetical protein